MNYGQLRQFLESLGFTLHRLARDGETLHYYEIRGEGGPELFLPAFQDTEAVDRLTEKHVIAELQAHNLLKEDRPTIPVAQNPDC